MVKKHHMLIILELFVLISIKLILEYVYKFYISKIFAYEGYRFFYDTNSYEISWLFYFLGYICIKIKSNTNLYGFYILMLFLWYLPNIIFYSFNNQPIKYLLLLNIPFLLITLLTFNFKKNSLNIRNGKFYVLLISFILLTITLLHFIITTGGHLNFDFAKVYEQREQFGELSANGIFGYLNSWSFKIFSVILFSWAISTKRKFLIVFFIIYIILLFGFSGHKSSLTPLILIPSFYFIFKSKYSDYLIPLGVLAYLTINILSFQFTRDVMVLSINFRRIFMVPAFLNYTYLQFFQHNQFVYWSDSSISFWSDYRAYSLNLPYVIGTYLVDSSMGANTGFIASGYAQAGIWGIAIYSIIVTIIVNIINLLGDKLPKYIFLSLIIMPLSSLYTSSDLFTSLLTHGVILVILILLLYREKGMNVRLNNKIIRL